MLSLVGSTVISVFLQCWLGDRKGIRLVNTSCFKTPCIRIKGKTANLVFPENGRCTVLVCVCVCFWPASKKMAKIEMFLYNHLKMHSPQLLPNICICY